LDLPPFHGWMGPDWLLSLGLLLGPASAGE
jgi:hypothetical protein